VQGETRALADRAVNDLQAKVRILEALRPDSVADKVLLEEIAGLDNDLVSILQDCTRQLTDRRDSAVHAAEADPTPTDWSAHVHRPTGAQLRLETLFKQLNEE